VGVPLVSCYSKNFVRLFLMANDMLTPLAIRSSGPTPSALPWPSWPTPSGPVRQYNYLELEVLFHIGQVPVGFSSRLQFFLALVLAMVIRRRRGVLKQPDVVLVRLQPTSRT
jgi:hypothetical protein